MYDSVVSKGDAQLRYMMPVVLAAEFALWPARAQEPEQTSERNKNLSVNQIAAFPFVSAGYASAPADGKAVGACEPCA
jgi:hypothetical protein